jgi:hypothetical protein
MRKTLLAAAAAVVVLFACTKQKDIKDEVLQEEESAMPSARNCNSMEVLNEMLQQNPSMKKRMDEIEAFTANFINSPAAQQRLLADGTIEIPVVVSVLYKTTAQNISLAQIQSQIDVLNADFAATNADYNLTPTTFQAVRSGNIGVKFVLESVRRKQTNKNSWLTNDAIKKTSQGGLDPLSPTTKLNIWVGNLSNGILGYAQFPGGPAATDGVVLDDNATGSTGTAAAPFNKGRTATHEVGHWLNLRHIWGDATCGNDQVGDTPLHNTANYSCPAAGHRSTCTGTPIEMTMNYMDYTNDACMYMFSAGQKSRMLATFATGGGRNSFAQP